MTCARELIDSACAKPNVADYLVLLAEYADGSGSGKVPDEVAGYVCYGRTPFTTGTYDLYWLATSPQFQRRGIAAALCRRLEEEVRTLGGYLIRVETSSTEGYGSAQRFYQNQGYPVVCHVPDFYKPGDDLLIMCKRIAEAA